MSFGELTIQHWHEERERKTVESERMLRAILDDHKRRKERELVRMVYHSSPADRMGPITFVGLILIWSIGAYFCFKVG